MPKLGDALDHQDRFAAGVANKADSSTYEAYHPSLQEGIRIAVEAAHELRGRESALRDAVASGKAAAIIVAAQNFFSEEIADAE